MKKSTLSSVTNLRYYKACKTDTFFLVPKYSFAYYSEFQGREVSVITITKIEQKVKRE